MLLLDFHRFAAFLISRGLIIRAVDGTRPLHHQPQPDAVPRTRNIQRARQAQAIPTNSKVLLEVVTAIGRCRGDVQRAKR